ncbi:uncharacterized protein N7459_003107 [Penicillium hispanicum]|uniref:uncharacterized protein n=1 Tax=Penicillium hispanicum TaxID=1080232 RepID=UPI00253F97FA|nr:uncharacterized protein N7459_003107 [Penicillium hispanicum]KAJ5587342.1 hypothetical protein N7459_003107 [Penicillium hispanicum]
MLYVLNGSMTEEPRRKRVRKGTKSCWECKRRKVKCIPSEDLSICVSCLERATPCLRQEYVDDQSPHHAEDSALAQRMARVESLLESLVDRIPWSHVDDLTPSSIPAIAKNYSRPLFESLSSDSVVQAEVDTPTGKIEILRRRLAMMLPCQTDVDFLFTSSHGWWLIQQHMMPHLPELLDNDFRGLFNVPGVSQGHPIAIARLLLCIAICIQQLPPDMDTRELQTTVPLREMMGGIIEFVGQNVISDDELTGSVEGVECLALQGMYEVNAGNIRRSWLSFRKAITIAQLLGLHRVAIKLPLARLDLLEAKRHHLWYQISRGERYLSTLLGVPSCTGSAVFPFADDAAWLSPEDLYHKNLYHISGLILARNQEDCAHSFSTTQRISEKLDSLAEQMPPAWWEMPTNILTTRTKEASIQFERIMCQIWHFELATLVHLPFMLRAATDRRYEHSRLSCLNASRNLINRWTIIRENHSTLLFSNLLEFQAFTAATTLLLGLLGPSRDLVQERHEDSQLIERVVQNFERLKQRGIGMSVGAQSISVIRTLQLFLHGETPSDRLRLEIPFFGIIKIARSGNLQPLEGERMLGANSSQKTFIRPALSTVFSSTERTERSPILTSCSGIQSREMVGNGEGSADIVVPRNDTIWQFSGGHFQLSEASYMQGDPDISEWPFQEIDTMLFDSLANTDLVGDWAL